MSRNNILELMENIGFMILFSVFYIELIATTLISFSLHLSAWVFPISLLLTVLTVLYIRKENVKIKEVLLCIAIFLAVFLISCFLSGSIYGRDWDGNEYHKMAIGLLKNGWNPIAESASTFAEKYFYSDIVNSYAIWIDHYAKGSWMFSAVVYAVTGNLECSKVYHLLGMLCLLMFSVPYLVSKQFNWVRALLFSVIIVFNPISLSQMFSFYVDGLLTCYLFVLILGLLKLCEAKNDMEKRRAWFMIWGSMPALANIKFTGLLYGGIFCIVFYLLSCFLQYYKEKKMPLNYIFNNGCCFFALALFSIIWLGYPTYVKNFLDHGTCTYPLTGTEINILRDNAPRGFDGKSNFFKLFYSIFGRYSNFFGPSGEELPILKIPFSIHRDEIVIPDLDARISGFGLLFSGILIVSIVICVIWFLKSKESAKTKLLLMVLTITATLMTFFISGSWWARFTPYLYIIPLTAVFICLKNSKQKWGKALCTIFLSLVLVNSFFFVLQPVKAIKGSFKISKELKELSGKSVEVSMINFWGRLFNFDDYNIEYKVVNDISQQEGECYLIFDEPVKWKSWTSKD